MEVPSAADKASVHEGDGLMPKNDNDFHVLRLVLNKILSHLDLLTSANGLVASSELKQAEEDLARVRPVLEKMFAGREELDEALAGVEDGMSGEAG